MDELAGRFEAERARLLAVAYRMLGSRGDAEDAVQEAWLRLARAGDVENLPAWLRTVVTRICLDLLRARRSRREELTDQVPDPAGGNLPEDTAMLADAVSGALLVVLDRLEPAERVAFVLHDLFAVPFDQIAPMLERTPVTTKKLASRARRKVRGTPTRPPAEFAAHRRVVAAFLAAARAGDLPALLAVLAPDVVRHADAAALRPGTPAVLRGARAVAEGTVLFAERARYAELALVDGAVGLVVAPAGRLVLALTFVVEGERVVRYDVFADPARLRLLELGAPARTN